MSLFNAVHSDLLALIFNDLLSFNFNEDNESTFEVLKIIDHSMLNFREEMIRLKILTKFYSGCVNPGVLGMKEHIRMPLKVATCTFLNGQENLVARGHHVWTSRKCLDIKNSTNGQRKMGVLNTTITEHECTASTDNRQETRVTQRNK